MSLAELAVVGEFTCEVWGDDYFLAFVAADGTWSWFSRYGRGVDEVVAELQKLLSSPLTPRLVRCTVWAHVVLWPSTLAGEPLFRLTEASRNWWQRLFTPWVSTSTVSLSDAVREYLRSLGSSDERGGESHPLR
jgi:hypothetical protein